jgi:hypothetical protein
MDGLLTLACEGRRKGHAGRELTEKQTGGRKAHTAQEGRFRMSGVWGRGNLKKA